MSNQKEIGFDINGVNNNLKTKICEWFTWLEIEKQVSKNTSIAYFRVRVISMARLSNPQILYN